ncbi:MAG: hypothetical protein DRP66_08495 [Planctomycetota bacterium]|nr:MAG: hypothetical protein DRP66_08495 [Planctomycetota bacterium]
MKRLAEKQVLEWKDSTRRKPLIIRGARQVGKTWLVESFLAKQFDSFAKIDLEKRRDLHIYFEGNLDPKTIFVLVQRELDKSVSQLRDSFCLRQILNPPSAGLFYQVF